MPKQNPWDYIKGHFRDAWLKGKACVTFLNGDGHELCEESCPPWRQCELGMTLGSLVQKVGAKEAQRSAARAPGLGSPWTFLPVPTETGTLVCHEPE